MKLLHVDASAKRATSNSRALSRHFIDLLQQEMPALSVDYLDLTVDVPAHVTEEFARAIYTPEARRSAEMRSLLADSDRLSQQLLAADWVVFAMPMYNWSMPSVFKAYIDNIIRAGLTYISDEHGIIHGQLVRQQILFLTTRGADLGPESRYAGMDALTPALHAAFKFIGAKHMHFINAEPLEFAQPQAREAGLAKAKRELAALVQQWVSTETNLGSSLSSSLDLGHAGSKPLASVL